MQRRRSFKLNKSKYSTNVRQSLDEKSRRLRSASASTFVCGGNLFVKYWITFFSILGIFKPFFLKERASTEKNHSAAISIDFNGFDFRFNSVISRDLRSTNYGRFLFNDDPGARAELYRHLSWKKWNFKKMFSKFLLHFNIFQMFDWRFQRTVHCLVAEKLTINELGGHGVFFIEIVVRSKMVVVLFFYKLALLIQFYKLGNLAATMALNCLILMLEIILTSRKD